MVPVGFLDLPTGAVRAGARAATPEPSSGVAFSTDGRIGVSDGRGRTGCSSGTLRTPWPSRPSKATPTGSPGLANSSPVDAPSTRAGSDGQVLIWDLTGRRPPRPRIRLRPGQPRRHRAAAELPDWSAITVPSHALSAPDGRLLAAGREDGTVKLTDVRHAARALGVPVPRGARRACPRHRLRARAATCSPWVATTGSLALVDRRTGRRVRTLDGHGGHAAQAELQRSTDA